MQAWGPGTPLAHPLFFLQEQRPPELSPVAGDGERASSSRYPEPPELAPPPFTPSPCTLSSSLNFSTLPVLPLPFRREEPAGEERRRPDTLQLWQERERRQQQQQQQSGVWGAPKKDRCGHRLLPGGGPWKLVEMSPPELLRVGSPLPHTADISFNF